MANCGKDILLHREGTEQQQRFVDALNPDFVKLNDFDLKDWMKFAYNFASHVNYFSTNNHKTPSDNWHAFFKSEDELDEFLEEVKEGGSITPHLALFVVFVKLLEITQKRFNKLTKRHLDFYYKEILHLDKADAKPDTVHIIFELAKNATSQKIARDTKLDAGKDSDSNKITYKITDEFVANQAKVAQVKSVYNDHGANKFKAAEVADSFDGKGAKSENDEISWWPFGYYEKPPQTGQNDLREYDELADTKIGFALSGDILELKEGARNVQITLSLDKSFSKAYSEIYLNKGIEVYCTGKKGWIGPLPVYNENVATSINSGIFAEKLNECKLAFNIPKEEQAVVNYDSKIHHGNYNSSHPVCKVLFKTSEPEGCVLYNEMLEKQITELKIDVGVQDILDLNLANDLGAINAKKPFYPFGTLPVKKSKFYIDYKELYKKKWDNLTIDIEWKNTPGNFKNWYFAYRKPEQVNYQISQYNFLTGIYKIIDLDLGSGADETATPQNEKPGASGKGFATLPPNRRLEVNNNATNFCVPDNNHFKLAVEKQEKEEWSTINNLKSVGMFTKNACGLFKLNLKVTNTGKPPEDIGPIRLSLNQSFYHDMYPKLYALAMISEDKDVAIPNEPYTPFIEEIKLAYNASASIKIENKNYTKHEFTLYHEYPFGQAEENLGLKQKSGILTTDEAQKLFIIPQYKHGGELYVALENAETRQNISLLIQLLEGSEKPDVNTSVQQTIEWFVLCNNIWKKLNSSDIIINNTNNFLKSGLFKFTLPKEATNNNSLLPAGYIWLRARLNKNYNLVSKAIGIHSQAVKAKFSDSNNNLQHLNNGLPAHTISKMQSRIPKVKKLEQPYNSFDGKPAETSTEFYRRVSERLRHKNRAITVWDYEHLVLQNFTELYKVKCLNHTAPVGYQGNTKPSFLAPGNSTLVVIPDIINKNVFDIYKPAVSAATLNKIKNYLNKLSSKLIQLHVINPTYEELSVQLFAKFRSGYEPNYYKTVLANDITKLLSPWAFDKKAGISFGVNLHKSVLIKYIEDLGYVDYVTHVKLFQLSESSDSSIGDEVQIASPSNPMSILVSARNHNIQLADISCQN